MTEVLIVVLAMVAFVAGAIAGGAWVCSIYMDVIDAEFEQTFAERDETFEW